MGTGFSKRKKQMKEMQAQFMKMQEDLKSKEIVGTAGNGLVTITLAGDHSIKGIKIKPDCVDAEDIEGLEDLIKAAYQDAHAKLEAQSSETMPQMPNLGF